MHPGALKILKFYPDLALHAKMAALPPSLVPAIDTFVPAERSTMGKKIWSSSIQEILVLTKSSIHMYVDTYVRSFMYADVKCLN